ncbi:transporter substrate-binding domain-containing protein [Pseudoalteromonas sp. MMG013]|uniref:substrate-binding periplasmic protein n=1 Tax=Pseudoalteromonas sp. MMG013 TaxID=2822687 RepID=UPI001B37CDC4|nr:transporter substrate-binding domain-containing protein [Pseudoalteromonas sp. MMG013]MBQ4864555.1 transporter substrate-binding domain-containing protein [Pseudoalteromonas sp. MMG013]
MKGLFYLAWFMLVSHFTAASPIKVVVGGHSPWPPYILEDGSGLVKEITVAAFAAQNIRFEIRTAPFSRVMRLLEQKEIDLVPALWWTHKRAQTLLFTEPYFNNDMVVVQHAKYKINFKGATSLRFLTMSTIRGYGYHEFLNGIEGLKVVPVLSLHASLQLVQKGRVDVAIADLWAVKHHLKVYPELHDLEVLYPALMSWPLHTGVLKTHPQGKEIIRQFNLGLAKIRKSGVYQQIVMNHLGDFE